MTINSASLRTFVVSLFLATASLAALSQEPPLIPRKLFDSAPEHDLLTISPDGKSIAYIAPSDKGVANIWVEDLATHRKRMVSRFTERGVQEFEWTYDSNHLIYHSDENGNEDYHLFSIDLQTGAVRDLTPFAGVRAEQVLQIPSRPDALLVGMNLRDPKLFDM
jgi:hypothetical protein